MVVDGTYYGKMTATKIEKILDKYRAGNEGNEGNEVTDDA